MSSVMHIDDDNLCDLCRETFDSSSVLRTFIFYGVITFTKSNNFALHQTRLGTAGTLRLVRWNGEVLKLEKQRANRSAR